MMEIGQICMKIAGRDAGKIAVIIEKVNQNFVMIDGETRRRKCNIAHLEPLQKKLEINENASHDDVKKAFKSLGIELKDKVKKEKKEKAAAEEQTLGKSAKKEKVRIK